MLDTILTENNNNNNNNEGNENKDEDKNENEDDDVNKDENEDDENKDENEDKNEECYIIKQINGYFKTIYEWISSEEQINLLREINFLYEY